MKNIKTIGMASVLGLAICEFTFAQSRHGGLRGHGASHHFKDAASAVEHLTETFPKFAAFDADKDGQLDATEKESLAKAIVEGTLQLPAHTPPDGVTPSAEMMLNHIASMYAQFAAFDANHDGALDATELAARIGHRLATMGSEVGYIAKKISCFSAPSPLEAPGGWCQSFYPRLLRHLPHRVLNTTCHCEESGIIAPGWKALLTGQIGYTVAMSSEPLELKEKSQAEHHARWEAVGIFKAHELAAMTEEN